MMRLATVCLLVLGGIAATTGPRAGIALTSVQADTARIVTATVTPRSTWVGALTYRVYVDGVLEATNRQADPVFRFGVLGSHAVRVVVTPDAPARDSLTRALKVVRPLDTVYCDGVQLRNVRTKTPHRQANGQMWDCGPVTP